MEARWRGTPGLRERMRGPRESASLVLTVPFALRPLFCEVKLILWTTPKRSAVFGDSCAGRLRSGGAVRVTPRAARCILLCESLCCICGDAHHASDCCASSSSLSFSRPSDTSVAVLSRCALQSSSPAPAVTMLSLPRKLLALAFVCVILFAASQATHRHTRGSSAASAVRFSCRPADRALSTLSSPL